MKSFEPALSSSDQVYIGDYSIYVSRPVANALWHLQLDTDVVSITLDDSLTFPGFGTFLAEAENSPPLVEQLPLSLEFVNDGS